MRAARLRSIFLSIAGVFAALPPLARAEESAWVWLPHPNEVSLYPVAIVQLHNDSERSSIPAVGRPILVGAGVGGAYHVLKSTKIKDGLGTVKVSVDAFHAEKAEPLGTLTYTSVIAALSLCGQGQGEIHYGLCFVIGDAGKFQVRYAGKSDMEPQAYFLYQEGDFATEGQYMWDDVGLVARLQLRNELAGNSIPTIYQLELGLRWLFVDR